MAVYAAQSIIAQKNPGSWSDEPLESNDPKHPKEPYIFLGKPPKGIVYQNLKTTLHLGEESIEVPENTIDFCTAIQDIEGCEEEISDLLIAAQTRDWDKHALEYFVSRTGIPVDRSFTLLPPTKEYQFEAHKKSNWVKWVQMLLVATGSSQPTENRLTGVAELLSKDIRPWMMLDINTQIRETKNMWELSGGSFEKEPATKNCHVSTDKIAGSLNWPKSRFVQITGTANGEHSGEFHIAQDNPDAPPAEENLIVGSMRMGDRDFPAKEGRRVFVGAWFDEAWFTQSMFAPKRIHSILKKKMRTWYPDFVEDGYHIPEKTTRFDGAYDRISCNKAYKQIQKKLNGNKMLGILGIPKSFHFAKADRKILN